MISEACALSATMSVTLIAVVPASGLLLGRVRDALV